jgi:hypothetical protein
MPFAIHEESNFAKIIAIIEFLINRKQFIFEAAAISMSILVLFSSLMIFQFCSHFKLSAKPLKLLFKLLPLPSVEVVLPVAEFQRYLSVS